MSGAKVAAVGQIGGAGGRDDPVAERYEVDRGAGEARRIGGRAADVPGTAAGHIAADEILEKLSARCVGQRRSGIGPILERDKGGSGWAPRFRAAEIDIFGDGARRVEPPE